MRRFGAAFGTAEAMALRLGAAGLPIPQVERLLDRLPSVLFFMKDTNLRYIAANTAMLAFCGVDERGDVIGRTARDFFSEATSQRYEARDWQIISGNKGIEAYLEWSDRTQGCPTWLLGGRWPVFGEGGALSGVVGVARKLEASGRRHATYQRLLVATEHLQANLPAPLALEELAHRVGVSRSQLERDFRRLFGLSPQKYLTKFRIEAALDLLNGPMALVEIAHECGYADQSAFTRQFRASVGVSPGEYRRIERRVG
jgi:AraC-like DNA-binding protein